MSARPLPPGGPERDIFILGLRRLSDDCSLPVLTPTCPFFEIGDQGPSCAEQCMDLLAEHPLPGPSRAEDLGGGLQAIKVTPVRHRRKPDADARPFDASRIRLRDADRPTDQKLTTSLVKDLVSELLTPPPFSDDTAAREYTISASHDELNRRGAPADLIIRCGAASRLEWSLVFSLLSREFIAAAGMEDDGPVDGLPDPDPRWLQLLEQARDLDGDSEKGLLDYATTGKFGSRVRGWLATAPLAQIIAWDAPSVDEFFSYPVAEWPALDKARATWLIDRFTETYEHAWKTDALAMEWEYLHGRERGCCQPDSMRERRTDAKEIARLLADRHNSRWKNHPSAASEPSFSPNDFVRVAASNLQAGRLEAAEAIFAAMLALHPDSSEANNNYGFCLLPTDVSKALRHLELAAETVNRTAVELTNATNRVLALHLLGRDEDALVLADRAMALPASRVPSFMWVHGEGGLTLTEPVPTREHLMDLVDHIRSSNRWTACG